jgi:hypothetical protein
MSTVYRALELDEEASNVEAIEAMSKARAGYRIDPERRHRALAELAQRKRQAQEGQKS